MLFLFPPASHVLLHYVHWLVVWNMNFIFPYFSIIYGIILPIDELHHFSRCLLHHQAVHLCSLACSLSPTTWTLVPGDGSDAAEQKASVAWDGTGGAGGLSCNMRQTVYMCWLFTIYFNYLYTSSIFNGSVKSISMYPNKIYLTLTLCFYRNPHVFFEPAPVLRKGSQSEK